MELRMDAMSDLVKVESVNEGSHDLALLLQSPNQNEAALEVKEMCDMHADLADSNSSDHILASKQTKASLSDAVQDHTMSDSMDLGDNSPGTADDSNPVQEMGEFSSVDIIALQNSATAQPMFQIVTSADGGSYVQLSDTQLIQAVTSVDQGLHSVTLPNGVTALIQQSDKQDMTLDGQAIQLEDGTTAIVHNIQPAKDQSMSTKLLEGQVIQLEDGTTGFIQPGLTTADMQSVQLEDGSTAYISLFGDGGGGALSIDSSTAQELQAPLRVIAGGEETNNQVAVSDDENMTAVSSVKQEAVLAEPAVSVITNDTRVTSENEPVSTNSSTQSHVSYKALALGDKAYKCPYEGCGRLYTTQHHLKVHGRSHTGDKPFRCEFPGCGKAFPTGYGLKSHTRVHTGEKPYRCTENKCTKAFKTSGDLQKHIRTHTGERPFKCPFEGCNRMFTTSNIRKVHIRTHTGERPYVCEEEGCNKSFASATNYKNHIRIHTGEKPYVCTVEGCGKRFTEYSSLYKHHIVHTQSKPYVCNHCHKTYRQTSTLAMHKRTVHNDHDTSIESSSLISTITGVQIVNPLPGSTADRESSDTDGTLVINTSESSLMIPNLQTLPQVSANLLQHLQPAGISVQGSGIQQVYLIADPSQIETLKQIASQQHPVSDVEAKKAGEPSDEGANTTDNDVSSSVVTTADQLLEGSNSVLGVQTIVSPTVEQSLVSYTAE